MAVSRNRRLFAAAVLAIAAALAALALVGRKVQRTAATDIGHGAYSLAFADGSAFTEATLTGAPSAVFFGYTHCPDVCPTTLGDLSTWLGDLGTEGQSLRVFFVTVDPERDLPAQIEDYVSWLPGAHGISGSRAETDRAIRAFRIFARKVPGSDGSYTYDHSSGIELFDRNGQFVQQIHYQEADASAEAKLRELLKQ